MRRDIAHRYSVEAPGPAAVPERRERIAISRAYVRAAREHDEARCVEVVRLYLAGCAMNTIGRALGMTNEAVRLEIVRSGVPIRRRGRRPVGLPVMVPVVEREASPCSC